MHEIYINVIYFVILCLGFSETAKTLINEDNARRGTIKVFEAIQNEQLNKHLFYVRRNVVVLECL